MTTRLNVLVWCLSVVFIDGCSGGSSAPKCIPGASVACACLGQQSGVQVCAASGAYGTCVCATPVLDAGSVGGIDSPVTRALDTALVGDSPEAQSDTVLAVPDPQPDTSLALPDAHLGVESHLEPASTLTVDKSSVDLGSNAEGIDGGVVVDAGEAVGQPIELGSSGVARVVVTNNGNAASGALAVVAGAAVSTSGCTGALAPGAFCLLTITATPTALGQFSSTVSIWATPGADTPIQIVVTATVVPRPANLVITPKAAALVSPAVGMTSAPIIFSLDNSGDVSTGDLTIAVTGANATDFTISPSAGCTSIAPLDTSCTITVVFTPKSEVGETALLTITSGVADGALGGSTLSIDLYGATTGAMTYAWGVGPEPCASPKDLSCAGGSGTTQSFNTTTEFCFRTGDIIAGWSCNNQTGWTMKINGQPVPCTSGPITNSTFPPALNGLYYFDFVGSSSAVNWASLSWYANAGGCKAPPYPSWSGGTTTSGSDAGTNSGG